MAALALDGLPSTALSCGLVSKGITCLCWNCEREHATESRGRHGTAAHSTTPQGNCCEDNAE